ncbi:MAG TPA: hypothetical protein VGR02_01310 [Thermoanaerobaculia bacterium]|jgi:hypothetical protein|nr:hypothetical protein [Thermoanaerobaculia bacterium]
MTLECYFSHSWAAEDVPLNVFVWETIADKCLLYVDREGAEGGAYYINRLEELIRKSDVFVSVLAYRTGQQKDDGRPDYRLCCSAASLFEIRLAERARKPRWIIFDDRTGFVPPGSGSDMVVYTPIVADEELHRGGATIRKAGKSWLKSVGRSLKNSATERSRNAALLLDDDAPDAEQVQATVEKGLGGDAGYSRISRIEPFHTDAEAVAILQASSLLVAEVGAPSLRELYGMAHALFIPSIRFMRHDPGAGDIPRLLEGHPGGYQHDLIYAATTADLGAEVSKRAQAMRDSRTPIAEKSAGCAYLRRRLYRKHQLFFSHNLAAGDADLLRLVFDQLESLGVMAWEYRHNNQAGVVWRDELDTALRAATDVAFIFGDEFELSPACSDELKTLLARRAELQSITPFLWGGRIKPNPELANEHHEQLPADKQRAAAVIVDRAVRPLRAKA